MPGSDCVYVVDDEAVRGAVSGLLEASGYLCRAFSSGQEFLTAAPTLRPGCLIADSACRAWMGSNCSRRLSSGR
jgi:FixJ family two-component response regulator